MEAVVLSKESVIRTQEAELRKVTNSKSLDDHHGHHDQYEHLEERPSVIQTIRRYSYQSGKRQTKSNYRVAQEKLILKKCKLIFYPLLQSTLRKSCSLRLVLQFFF